MCKVIHGHGQDSFLAGCLTEPLSSSLGVGQKPSSVSCHMSLSTGQLSACQFALSKQERERYRATVFHSPVTSEEVTSYHFCCVLFISIKSLGPAHTQREELHKDVNTRRWDHHQEPFQTDSAEAAMACLCRVRLHWVMGNH